MIREPQWHVWDDGLVLHCVQINNAGSIMSQRDVNAEGLEKSFATNVLGESGFRGEVWVKRTPVRRRDLGWCQVLVFFSLIFRCLYSHQESHSPAGEERGPQSGESQAAFVSRRQNLLISGSLHSHKLLTPVALRNTSYYFDSATRTSLIPHFNEHWMVLCRELPLTPTTSERILEISKRDLWEML